MKKKQRCGLSKAKIWILQRTLPQRFYLWVFAWHVLGGTSTPQRNHDAERDFLFSSAKSSFTTWREVPCLRPGASPVHQVAQLVQKHMLQVFNYASYHQPSLYHLCLCLNALVLVLITLLFGDSEFLWCCWDLGSCFAFVIFPVCVYCVCSCLHV